MKNSKSRHLFLFTLFAILSISIHSQDLIITSQGDSLNCKITKIETEYIYFNLKYKELIRSTFLPLNQVKYHQYNYYPTSIDPAKKVTGNEIYPQFRGAITLGWSYRLAKFEDDLPSVLERYMKKLKSGYNYGFDLSYYFSERLGFGFKINIFKSKYELYPIVVTMPDGSSQYARMSDNISISFVGPFISTRLLSANKKNCLLMNLGIGYTGYKNKASLVTDDKILGSSWGFCSDIGYDIAIANNITLGFQFAYKIGTLKEDDLSNVYYARTMKLETDDHESLSRIDLSISLIYSK